MVTNVEVGHWNNMIVIVFHHSASHNGNKIVIIEMVKLVLHDATAVICVH